ncbi:MAG TPA: ADP-ribosylglycohydrolase family protein [Longimicrobiales bacterium]
MHPTLDRFRGALLGLAVGDALGTTLEFRRPGNFLPITDMVGGGPFGLEPGQWTDDTSMALCLAESLVERQGFDPFDQLERYCRWHEEGHLSSTGRCFDIGVTTAAALARYKAAKHAGTLTTFEFGSTDPHSAGNGSIMRLAPVPMAFAARPLEAIEFSTQSSRTTHGATEAVDACRYLGALIVGALRGASKDELLAERYSPVPGYWDEHPLTPAIDEVARGSFRTREPPEIQGRRYVVKSLEAALWAFHRTSDFRSGCLAAVNLGDDADTTGAVYGQLAGAFYGASAIPGEWIERLALREKIEELAAGLFELAGIAETG